ncbi:hypothetical protein O6H91_04G121000 [Diphasiastrum complanatum]|nr:hypothetical protein O6H91_04G121000 [Diphasiastrum complanatum]
MQMNAGSDNKYLKKSSVSVFHRNQLDHHDDPELKRCPYSAVEKNPVPYVFQMPLHYPRFTKSDYEVMPEWKLDRLLEEYGLPVIGSLSEKRKYAMGCFLWKDQL